MAEKKQIVMDLVSQIEKACNDLRVLSAYGCEYRSVIDRIEELGLLLAAEFDPEVTPQ